MSAEGDTFELNNRVPLYKDRWNRWVLIVSREYAANDEDVRTAALDLVQRLEDGSAHKFKMLRTSATRIFPPGGVVKTREQLNPIPFVQPGPVVFALIEFAWQSATPDAPWPAVKGFLLRETDPVNADIVLDSVGVPGGETGPKQGMLEEAIDDVAERVSKSKTAQVGGMVALGVAIAWVLSKFGGRR